MLQMKKILSHSSYSYFSPVAGKFVWFHTNTIRLMADCLVSMTDGIMHFYHRHDNSAEQCHFVSLRDSKRSHEDIELFPY